MSGIEMPVGSCRDACVEMPVDADTDDYVECHNFHSNPTYESTLNSKCKAEEIIRSSDQEPDQLSHRETIHKKVHSSENSPMHELRARMTTVPETNYSEESGYCYVNPAYESTLNINCKLEENVKSGYKELDDLSQSETIRKRSRPPKNHQLNKLCVRVPAVPETDGSGNYNINPAYENVRLDDQEQHVRMPAVPETEESGQYHSNPAYENVRLGDQELHVRRPAVPETEESGKYHSNPAYENVRSDDQELERLSHRERICRSIQLPARGPMRNPCARMSLDPGKDYSGERINCHINFAYESTLNINYKAEENARSDDQELKLTSHREMIRRSIQPPERGPKREPRIKMSVVSGTDDSEESGKYHINLAYESTLDVNCRVEENRSSDDQELDRLSYREVIRRSIQLPERRPKRRKRCCCSLLEKDNKEERLFVAYLLLVVLFVMTFGSIGLTIIIRTIPLKFFPDCWMLTVALAFLTFLIGVYICWEDEICKSSRPRQEGIFIDIELATFAEN